MHFGLFCENCAVLHKLCGFSWIVWLNLIWGELLCKIPPLCNSRGSVESCIKYPPVIVNFKVLSKPTGVVILHSFSISKWFQQRCCFNNLLEREKKQLNHYYYCNVQTIKYRMHIKWRALGKNILTDNLGVFFICAQKWLTFCMWTNIIEKISVL